MQSASEFFFVFAEHFSLFEEVLVFFLRNGFRFWSPVLSSFFFGVKLELEFEGFKKKKKVNFNDPLLKMTQGFFFLCEKQIVEYSYEAFLVRFILKGLFLFLCDKLL
jgi:hypothetical protein